MFLEGTDNIAYLIILLSYQVFVKLLIFIIFIQV